MMLIPRSFHTWYVENINRIRREPYETHIKKRRRNTKRLLTVDNTYTIPSKIIKPHIKLPCTHYTAYINSDSTTCCPDCCNRYRFSILTERWILVTNLQE